MTGRRLNAASVAVAAVAVTLAWAATAHASLFSQLSTFGSPGSGDGQFVAPLGDAVQQASGDVFVVDAGPSRVDEFDANGNFLLTWGWGVKDGAAHLEVCRKRCRAGIAGSGPGQLSARAQGIAIGPSGTASASKVFVSDQGNNAVEEFDTDGNFLATIDGTGSPQGHFQNLAGVAVDQSGNLWTADAGTSNVDEFSPKGNFVRQWNTGNVAGQLSGIAVDEAHNSVYLVVSGATQRRTLTGERETLIDRNGIKEDLAVDPQTGNLYVDEGGRVGVYDPAGTRIDTVENAGPPGESAFIAISGRRLYVSIELSDAVAIFATPPAGPPLISSQSAAQTSKTTATLQAAVVPLGHDTSCKFQYVDDAAFRASGYNTATSVSCSPAGLGSSFTYQRASASVSGLSIPNVVYHFRVIATNSAGTTTGADTTFRTPPADWAPFSRCPVDDPAMFATTGGSGPFFDTPPGSWSSCLASNSPSGSITIGNLTTATGDTNVQAGLVGAGAPSFSLSLISPPGGAIVADSVLVLGGAVTATLEPAGTPSDFSLSAAFSTGRPILTLPVKIHLESASLGLGPDCFIGSEQNPIVLHPENTDLSNAASTQEQFDPGGSPDPNGPLERLSITGAVQGDDTFVVPAAQGCGVNDSLDGVINSFLGLPSPSGSNHLVLNDVSSALAVPFDAESGEQFAGAWHLAFG